MELTDFELGYTPSNLKKIRAAYNLTQQQVADVTGVGARMVIRWEAQPESTTYSNMPHHKWLVLLEHIKNVK